jgi:hypothetical protein
MENHIENEIDYDSVGTEEQFVARASDAQEKAIDDALGLQPISIRLQRDLLDNLKALALLNGLGYQPLIRQVLTRWVDCELKNLLNDKVAMERAKTKAQNAQPAQKEEPMPPDQRLAA